MKKYKTKPITYEGCDPVIAEHLRRGEAVLCKVWDNNSTKEEKYVLGFFSAGAYPYGTDNDQFEHAEAIEFKTETRVKKASEICKWMEDRGVVATYAGVWEFPPGFTNRMFQYCGKVPSSKHKWHPDWLEEVEVK